MADNLQDRGQRDRDRINTSEEHEVRYWCEALGITRTELEEAVRAVGPMADDVREHLGK